MKSCAYLLLGYLVYSPFVLAKTDWTPIFASMQKNCDFHSEDLPKLFANLPAQYQSSVQSSRLSQNKQYTIKKMTLKNSQAFGYPLIGVELGLKKVGLGDYLTLYFANKNFVKLKTSFTMNSMIAKFMLVNNKNGLLFMKQAKRFLLILISIAMILGLKTLVLVSNLTQKPKR